MLCPVVFLGGRLVEAEGRKASGAAVHSAASVLTTPHAQRFRRRCRLAGKPTEVSGSGTFRR